MNDAAGGTATGVRPHVLVMGVSGSGKTSVGAAVASALGAAFVEGDDEQPPENIAKMASGRPLTDEDRAPWLARLAAILRANDGTGRRTVVAASALRRVYRDLLREAVPAGALLALELDVPRDTLESRMRARRHFMPPELLDSQLATLEPLGADELGVRLDASRPLEDVVDAALDAIRATG